MYLKQLTLQGFKSFPDKTKVYFDPGVTAVVGPNGSGKSNLSDAVRWVLGEQRAKSLRGEKMEDVIFSGTRSRRPMGFAEVTMLIDNSDHRLPLDYEELAVTRRVYRSGDSEYLINGTTCRLKDVYGLFMDTGIGREGYSIISQGRVDEILNSRGEERRKLFEEAAGIVKFRSRRAEAEARLEKERANLVRVGDILQELDGRVQSLRVQAEAARQFLRLRDRQKELEVGLFRLRQKALLAEAEKREQDWTLARGDWAREQEAQAERQAQRETLRQALAHDEAGVNEAAARVTELRSRWERLEADRRLLAERAAGSEENARRSGREAQQEQEAAAARREAITLLQTRQNALRLARMGQETMLARRERELEQATQSLTEQESVSEQGKTGLIEALQETNQLQGSLQRARALQEQLEQRQGEIAGETRVLEIRIAQETEKAEEIARGLEEVAEESAAVQAQRQELLEKGARQETALRTLREGISAKERELSAQLSRLHLLRDMQKDYEGFYHSVKAVLTRARAGERSLSGIRGAVGELLRVEREYEVAIEVALGANVQNIVTRDENAAGDAIRFLKQNRLGRATFIPLTATKPRSLGREKDALLREPGVLGVAADLVSCDPEFRAVAENLLGMTLVVDTMDHAIALSKKYKQKYRLVTQEGELFAAGGAMTGGSRSKNAAPIFGRSREIEALETETATRKSALQALTAQRDAFAAEQEQMGEQRQALETEARRLSEEKLVQESEQRHYAQLLAADRERQADLKREETRLREQLAQARDTVAQVGGKLARREQEIGTQKEEMERLQTRLELGRKTVEACREALHVARLDQERTEKEEENVVENISRENREMQERLAAAAQREAEQRQALAAREESRREMARLDTEERVLEGEREAAQAALTDWSARQEAGRNALTTAEQETESGFARLSRLETQASRLEMLAEKAREELKSLRDGLWNEFELTWQAAEEFPEPTASRTELQAEAGQLRRQIKALGPVNPAAVEEFAAASERRELLCTQRDDILATEEKLSRVVQELTGQMEQQFQEKMSALSESFNLVFREMFGGGQAALRLGEGNALEAAIEVVAQPPGKTLQSMTLLSGGERTLTAIAILFAILRQKPSPFCILDETEAALDDANVRRYAEYLKKVSDGTQLIVVTHRKGTMEAADALYGVTMQEQGVSKMVSVTLRDAARNEA